MSKEVNYFLDINSILSLDNFVIGRDGLKVYGGLFDRPKNMYEEIALGLAIASFGTLFMTSLLKIGDVVQNIKSTVNGTFYQTLMVRGAKGVKMLFVTKFISDTFIMYKLETNLEMPELTAVDLWKN